MDSTSNYSRGNGGATGAAAEHQPLLPSPPFVNHPNVYTAIDAKGVATDDNRINSLLESRMKLGASALNFFLSGAAMAAVGVGITAQKHTSEAC